MAVGVCDGFDKNVICATDGVIVRLNNSESTAELELELVSGVESLTNIAVIVVVLPWRRRAAAVILVATSLNQGLKTRH